MSRSDWFAEDLDPSAGMGLPHEVADDLDEDWDGEEDWDDEDDEDWDDEDEDEDDDEDDLF
jgi:hypothetical protein